MKKWQAMASVLFILYLALVSYLSLAESGNTPGIRSWDKLAHTLAYSGFAILSGAVARRHWQLLLLLLACAGYGLLMEYLQGLTTYRQASIGDMIANITGLVVGYMVLRGANHWRPLPACSTGTRDK